VTDSSVYQLAAFAFLMFGGWALMLVGFHVVATAKRFVPRALGALMMAYALVAMLTVIREAMK
jgi:hypothetical protein